jgi:hypothetical protein
MRLHFELYRFGLANVKTTIGPHFFAINRDWTDTAADG